ncbi:MAG: SBBP repeat-containing protein, partial [Candidatus Cloacimonadaceae bacterium]|nr:SBBP repeat-containing protein [Candidatus Cloacimonadaceae bacterium]
LSDAFVAKLDPDGNYLWAIKATGGSNVRGYGIAVSSTGYCYVTGSFVGALNFGGMFSLLSVGGADIFVAKLDTDGNWIWADRFGYDGHDRGIGIAVDDDDNCYMTGLFKYTSAGRDCVFIGKWNSSGTRQWWSEGYPSLNVANASRGTGIAVSSTGDAYITGLFNRNIQFGSGANSVSLTGSGSDDIFVAKINTLGTWQWARGGGGTARDQGHGIAVDGDDNCYVTGYFASTPTDFGDSINLDPDDGAIFVAKLNPSGTWQWVSQAGGDTVEQGLSIVADNDGNCYVTGIFKGIGHFGDKLVQSNSNSVDVFVAKINTSGVWQWAQLAGGASEDWGLGIAIDDIGNCYVTGTFSGLAAYFGSTTLSSSGGVDIFISRLSPVFAFPPLIPMPLLVGDELVTITVLAGAGFNSGEAGLLPPINNPGDGYLSFWLNGSGIQSFDIKPASEAIQWGAAYFNEQWHSYQRMGESISFTNVDFGSAKGNIPIILQDEDPTLPVQLSSFTATVINSGNILLRWTTESESGIVGYYLYRSLLAGFDSALLVSPLIQATNTSTQSFYSFTDTELFSSGTYYYWLESKELDGSSMVYGPITVLLSLDNDPNGVPEAPIVTDLHSLYPNPFNPQLFIPFSLEKESGVEISIFNSRGQMVYRFDLGSKSAGEHRILWNGKHLNGTAASTGIYYIRMYADGQVKTRKAVLIK